MPRKPKIEVYVGFKINRLTLIEMLEPRRYYRPNGLLKATTPMARWRCECGKEFVSKISHVTHEATKSCGCLGLENRVAATTKHGLEGTRVYLIHQAMKNRCFNKNIKGYADYGARGITVCDRWRGEHGFENFMADMGFPPSDDHEIERVDCNGNYEPSNCVWLHYSKQNRNKRTSVRLTLDGVPLLQRDLAQMIGVEDAVIATRLKRGETPEQIRDFFVARSKKICSHSTVRFRDDPSGKEIRVLRSGGGYSKLEDGHFYKTTSLELVSTPYALPC